MKFYLPTFEECREIVEKNESFYESNLVVDGYNVTIFNYRLAEYEDFIRPIKGKDIQATELRGITFVHDGEKIHRFLALHKFFNLNQCKDYQYEDVKFYDVVRAADKCDGSMITFVRLPNGKILPKTKMNFSNDQCKMAQKVYNQNEELQAFVKESLELGLVPVFELTSAFNRIVLEYDKTELILLQIRDGNTGSYLNVYEHELVKKYNIKTAEVDSESKPLSHYMELAKTVEGKEGWIITLSNGQILKVKCDWYCQRHGILTDYLVKEDRIIELIFEETLDDALALVGAGDVRYIYATTIYKEIIKYLAEKEKEVLELINDYNGDRKAWGQKHFKNKVFVVAARSLNCENRKDKIYKELKAILQKKTYRLEQARTWLRERGISLLSIQVNDGEE